MRRYEYMVIKSVGKPDTKLAAKLVGPIVAKMFLENKLLSKTTKLADLNCNKFIFDSDAL